jgi:hypothetical protein
MDLREAIIRTVCYFDLFDYPLTREEIAKWLYGASAGEGEVRAAVNALVDEKKMKEENGLVFFSDREGLAAVRAERKIFSDRKWKRARRWARVYAALPGVELVGVGNTLAYDNAKDGSDIDFFIVTAAGAIWRTRFLCAALAAVFDLRPKANDNRDKLCLSFFVTTEALEMLKLARGSEDIYMYYWTRLMRPLFGKTKTYELFRAANPEVEPLERICNGKILRVLLSPLALLPGAFMRSWQKRRFPKPLIAAEAKHDYSVIISDTVLKFHVIDRRADIYERWTNRVKSMLS